MTPDCRVEVLIPDFQGIEESLRIVLDAKPDVSTQPQGLRLCCVAVSQSVRSGARYERTLRLLEKC